MSNGFSFLFNLLGERKEDGVKGQRFEENEENFKLSVESGKWNWPKTYIRVAGDVQNMYEAGGHEHLVVPVFLMYDCLAVIDHFNADMVKVNESVHSGLRFCQMNAMK